MQPFSCTSLSLSLSRSCLFSLPPAFLSPTCKRRLRDAAVAMDACASGGGWGSSSSNLHRGISISLSIDMDACISTYKAVRRPKLQRGKKERHGRENECDPCASISEGRGRGGKKKDGGNTPIIVALLVWLRSLYRAGGSDKRCSPPPLSFLLFDFFFLLKSGIEERERIRETCFGVWLCMHDCLGRYGPPRRQRPKTNTPLPLKKEKEKDHVALCGGSASVESRVSTIWRGGAPRQWKEATNAKRKYWKENVRSTTEPLKTN